MGLRDTIRAAGRGMTKVRAAETSKAEEDDEDQMEESAEADAENEDTASAETDTEDDGVKNDNTESAEDDGGSAKAARMSERRRIRNILKCAEAGTSPDLAMELAFETGMSASTAQNLLKAAAKGGAAKASNLGGRMKTEGDPKLGAGGEGDNAASTDDAQGRLLSLAKARKAQRAA